MKTARVKDLNGVIHTVRAFDEFTHTIDGETFEFVITKDLLGAGLNVIHKASGGRVCVLPDSIRNVVDATLMQRALDCVTRLVDRVGPSGTRSLLTGATLLPSLKWLAGCNIPGCTPEEPFAEFDTFQEAHAYIVAELERVADNLHATGENYQEALLANRAKEWAERQRDAFTISPVQGYSYEVTRSK